MGLRAKLLGRLLAVVLVAALLSSTAAVPGAKNASVKEQAVPGTSGPDTPDSHTPFSWDTRNLLVAVGVCLCALLANSAGVGGGPLYIPLFNTVLGFDIPHCTALSHTVVSVSAVGSSLYGMLQPSPTHPDRPLLNFDLALTFIPPLLFGVSVGVAFNSFVPEWLQVLLLVFLLGFVIKNIVAKGVKQFRHEQAAFEKQAHAQATGRLWRESALTDPSRPKGIIHDESFHPVDPEGEFVDADHEQPLLEESTAGMVRTLLNCTGLMALAGATAGLLGIGA
ncbi:hypothetical protein WJX84_006798 [Apatococcus fuscideae]|uniref:Membrane transporter protein n=1 Tax=Apatococcus fuscideae TaxID=2026836 RepID=A0AAW1SXC5_9CHLO